MILQYSVNALLLGGLYALMGLGFSLQWGISGIINLSYGAWVILGSYLTYALFQAYNIDPFISMFIISGIFFVLGSGVYQVILQRSLKGAIFLSLILTFALRLIIENIILLVWSGDYRTIRLAYATNIQFGNVFVPVLKVVVFLVAVVLIYSTYLFFSNSKIGKGIMAVALDKEGAQAVGLEVGKMYMINFALGTAMAGLTGSLWAIVYSFHPLLISIIVFKVFIIAILGGLGNIWGAAAGGLLLAIVETFTIIFFGSQWQDGTGMFVLVVVLLLRPHGLIGRRFF